MNDDPASLDKMHDILEPQTNVWWPLAAGWYWLSAFALLIAIYFLVRWYLRWRHNCYRREALAELAHWVPLLKDPIQRSHAFYKLAELLKRTAITAYPRTEVASLTGSDWFSFLDRTGNTSHFTDGSGSMLERSAYDAKLVTDLDEIQLQRLAAAVRHWLKTHCRELDEVRRQ